jgi:hypothetical protein
MLILPPVWNADLKPSPPGVAPPDDESGASTPCFPQPQSALPDFDSQSASGFPGPVPSPQPYAPSIAYTTSTGAVDPFYISTPKPDILVGLEDRAFAPTHRLRLAKHQSFGSILSDPHTAAMGLRFPFLIAETKGLSLNGGLDAVQIQLFCKVIKRVYESPNVGLNHPFLKDIVVSLPEDLGGGQFVMRAAKEVPGFGRYMFLLAMGEKQDDQEGTAGRK